MNLDRLSIWLTLATNLAVLLGVVFLVIEIRQNTTTIRGQSSFAVNDALSHLNEALYSDSVLTDIWIRGRESLDSLDANERERFSAFLLERLNLALYMRELERANTADVHIDWIDVIRREIESYSGICDFVASGVDLQNREMWATAIRNCSGGE